LSQIICAHYITDNLYFCFLGYLLVIYFELGGFRPSAILNIQRSNVNSKKRLQLKKALGALSSTTLETAKYNPQPLRPHLHRKANRTAAAPILPLGCVFSHLHSVDLTFIMNYELPCVLIRFGSEFILSNATKTRCAAAVRAQHGDALGHVTWSWQRGWATSMQPSSFHSLCRPLSSGPSGRSPSAWRQAAAAATRGGSTARLRLAGRGGVIAARRYCEGMQQRRPCFRSWQI
jgi:hypothetical protein